MIALFHLLLHHQDLRTLTRKKRKMKDSKDFAIKVISIRKPKQPNWEQQEVVSLVLAIKKDHEASLGVVDSRDCFENISVKWKKKTTLMMASGHNAHINGLVCKENWTTIYNDYKQF
jgi:hypothetical protein